MSTRNWLSLSAIRTGGSCVCELALKMIDISLLRNHSGNNAINEILLYGAEHEKYTELIGLNNLLCIYYRILHAKKSVDVCVPSFVSNTFAKCLIKVHQNNKAKIRIIIHKSNNFKNLQLLAKNGIDVKVINPDVHLEHDFLLIDASDDAVAVMGSLDYDTTQVNCNRDATVLTSDSVVTAALKREFDRVWNSVSDIRYSKNDKNK